MASGMSHGMWSSKESKKTFSLEGVNGSELY